MTDKQCSECTVLGGRSEPCLGESYLAAFAEANGRRCPRVEFLPGNRTLLPLVKALLDARLAPLVPIYAENLLDELPVDERREHLSVLHGVFQSQKFHEAMEFAAECARSHKDPSGTVH